MALADNVVITKLLRKFRSGNFDARNEERGRRPKKFQDSELLLKPGETVNTERYWQQMIDLNQALREKRSEYQKRQHKVILLRDNAPSHTAKPVKETIEAFSWEILTHQTWLRPITIYLHRWDTHFLTSTLLLTKMYENASMTGLPQKNDNFLAWHPPIAREPIAAAK